jgi:hypothetical protein
MVMWNFDESLTPEQKRENAVKIKTGLEEMRYCVEGVENVRVVIDPLPSSNADLMLDSAFASEEALAAYRGHPEHRRVLEFINSCVSGRRCVDYVEIESPRD